MKKTAFYNSFLPHEQEEDTICALSTPPGEGALALIRVSGKRAFEISQKLCPFLPSQIHHRKVYFGTLLHPEKGQDLDEVLVFCFEKGRSFTGEESVEISSHGSPFVVSSILEALESSGARLAKRGEFSYRAFMNGKIDLLQAESVLALIQSRSPKAHAQALRGLKGKSSLRLKTLEKKLLKLLSHIEAEIDFSDQDIKPFSLEEQKRLLWSAIKDIKLALKGFEQGRINREGFSVVLSGAPNAGKSSLFNYLLEEDRAIVTAEPGTTRDVLSARFLWKGREFCLKDSAGFRVDPDPLEQKGIKKALEEIKLSDLCLFLVEGTLPLKEESFFGLETGKEKEPLKTILVFSKADKVSPGERKKFLKSVHSFFKKKFPKELFSPEEDLLKNFWVSSQTGEGIEELKNLLYKKSEKGVVDIFLSTPRQHQALEKIKYFLEQTENLLNQKSSPEFIAFELKSALTILSELLGKEYSEEVIQNIFKEFCIGK